MASGGRPGDKLTFRVFARIGSLSILRLSLPTIARAEGPPSGGAKALPRALGTSQFEPTDWMEGKQTWWIDSDGVDSAKAGCHVGTDANGKLNGRALPRPAWMQSLRSNPIQPLTKSITTRATLGIPTNFSATPGASVRVRRRAYASGCTCAL